MSLEADPEAELELPPRFRTIQRAHRTDFQGQAARVDAKAGADAAYPGAGNRDPGSGCTDGSRFPVPGSRDKAAVGKHEEIGRASCREIVEVWERAAVV